MATQPGEKATDTTRAIPSIDANVIQAGQVIPGTIIQPERATQRTKQFLNSLNNQPRQNSHLGLWEELRKVESSTLGAVQIIIGLIHIGFGSVSAVLLDEYAHYKILATYGAYPFWGGIFFIASGSLSVSAEKLRNTCLVQCCVGMNITSAIMALAGAILYTAELIINVLDLHYNLTESVGFGISFLLLIFSLLEFCITVSTAHFGCQASCCKNDMGVKNIYRSKASDYNDRGETSTLPMATDTQRMANGATFFFSPYGANIVQAGQIFPSTVIQPGGFIQYAGQTPSPPSQNPQMGALEKMLKVETKTLGAIQVMTGLIHIGLGAVAVVFCMMSSYFSVAIVGGYPFWGGLFFIISGSLSVAVENHLRRSLVKWSVGMNITSAIMALTGVILILSGLVTNAFYWNDRTYSIGNGLDALLLFFSLLEFCITVSTAHFGCQAACCNSDPAPMVFVPCTVSEGVASAEADPAPPAYETFSPK